MKSGVGLFAVAALLVLAHGVAELAGLRDWVSVLSGTPVAGVPWEEAALGGLIYVASYFGAVLAAPICAIAGALCILSRVAFERAPARQR